MTQSASEVNDNARNAALTLGARLHGFEVASCEPLPEIDGTAWIMRHAASGARLLFLENDDENKAFSIAFKTPPRDNTGVFHILEHSVLCGSDRFPVKEPFVNLLKTSMQTFLNAMTFPDKTMYPVASTNEQDLLNLMDVYMDAVLHPAIFRKPEIFWQEGWHFEWDESEGEGKSEGEPDPGTTGESEGEPGKLSYNGVVYNEMKGVLSSSENVLYDALQAALFPDTPYRFESGGVPESIVTLSYEQFLDEHRRHYRLDNSYIVLYGDMNISRVLAFLDGRYLATWAEEQRTCESPGSYVPRTLPLQQPVVAENITHTMETSPENACCALGFVVGEAKDREKIIAADILIDALAGSNEAPLKAALLGADLADDVNAFLADSMLQPFVGIQLKGAHVDVLDRLRTTTRETMERLTTEGIDPQLIEASLSHAEFVMRESDFGISDGVALAISAMAGWLYDDDDSLACAYIRYEDAFASLREKLDTNYFNDLAREIFLDCPHRASVEIVAIEPGSDPNNEAARLAAIEATLDAEQQAVITDQVRALRAAQEHPDSAEELASLPVLRAEDIGPAKPWPDCTLRTDTPLPCLYHEVNTRGIAYATHYYDISCVDFEELPYLSILALLLGKLDTARHTAAELDTITQRELGNLTFFCEVHGDGTPQLQFAPEFVVGASALGNHVKSLCTLPLEILHETRFDDLGRIRDILTQKRFAMEQNFMNAGHTAARDRLLSYILPSGMVADQLGGVEFYRFLKRLLNTFDAQAESLVAHLGELSRRVFCENKQLVSFAGGETALAQYFEAHKAYTAPTEKPAEASAAMSARTPHTAPQESAHRLQVPQPVQRNEAFIIPSDISFTALGHDRRLLESCANTPYNAAWQIVSRALSYDFLWNEVRVKGGAYGVGFLATQKGALQFYSYRDPRIDETLERFAQSADWLADFSPSADEMEGYVVSTVAGADAPVKPRSLIRAQDTDYFAGRSKNWRAQARADVLEADAATIRSFAPSLREAVEKQAVCTFGGKTVIESAKTTLNVVDLLNE